MVIRNTFLIVAVLGLLTVAYSYSGALYKGQATISVQVQPDYSKAQSANYDAVQTAQQNSDIAVQELTSYASGTQYFKNVSQEVYGTPNKWKSLQQGTKGIYQIPNSHEIYFEWDGNSTAMAQKVVSAEVRQLRNYVPQFQHAAGMPTITAGIIDPAFAQRISLSKPVIDFLLRAALGLVAGIILAYLFEYLDDSLQDENDVQHWMHIPTLAVIPGGRASRPRSA
jgi:capsular polysaccharide biosynthesis protein